MQKAQRVLVVGATGGSGRAVVDELLAAGHFVTAFSRSAHTLEALSDRITAIDGDASDSEAIDSAVRGHDAVVVTLGITENPLRVRLLGSAGTPMDIRSTGTRNVVAAMRRHGIKRLVVQSSYGVGESRDRLRLIERLFFGLLLKPQIADTEVQELEVRKSGVDWVLAQPVHLTDDEVDDIPFTSADGSVCEWKVSRKSVARFLADAVESSRYIGHSVAVSGGGAARASA